MKKRILAFTLVLAMTLFCFAGCGKKQEAVKDTPDKTMTDVTLNEVAHSIFMRLCTWLLKKGILQRKAST